MAFLNKGLRITLTDERAGTSRSIPRTTAETGQIVLQPRTDTFLYERGLVDYVEYLNRSKKADLVNDEIISFESEDTERKIALEVAMQWTTAYTENVHTYANTINTHEGGTHEEGFRAALTTLVNKYAREKGILKEKDDNLSGDDVREGLTAVISVKLSEPQFEGQTKTKLGNTEAKSFVQKVTGDQLGDWFERNPTQARDIIRKAIQAATARLAARKAREADPPQGPARVGRHARQAQGLLVEGPLDLARSSSSRATRPAAPPCRAATPRRRRSCRCAARSSTSRRPASTAPSRNNEVQAMITAFGAGIGEDFNTEKARYHKIVLMADADVDGQHITTLLLTLLFRYMRPLIELGYVYLAQPPLYRLKWTNADARVRLLRPGARRAARRRHRRAASASRRTTASSATRVSAR